MYLFKELNRLNKKLETCQIDEVKQLSHQKTMIIYKIVDVYNKKSQFYSERKSTTDMLRHEVDRLSTIVSEGSYIDSKTLKDLKNKLLKLKRKND